MAPQEQYIPVWAPKPKMGSRTVIEIDDSGKVTIRTKPERARRERK
jgi:hypothetical protein